MISNKIKINIMEKLKELLKKTINSIKIPSLVSFILNQKDETKKEENWDRLGLEKTTSIGLPVYLVILPLFIIILLYFSTKLINIIFYVIGFSLLFYILLKIINSFKK